MDTEIINILAQWIILKISWSVDGSLSGLTGHRCEVQGVSLEWMLLAVIIWNPHSLIKSSEASTMVFLFVCLFAPYPLILEPDCDANIIYFMLASFSLHNTADSIRLQWSNLNMFHSRIDIVILFCMFFCGESCHCETGSICEQSLHTGPKSVIITIKKGLWFVNSIYSLPSTCMAHNCGVC